MRIFICLAAVLPLVGMNTRPPNTTQKPRSTERPVNATSAGRLEEVRLDRVKHSTLDIFNPVGEAGVVSWRRTKERVDAVSDMVFHDGKLFVAGLSNEEFSSVRWTCTSVPLATDFKRAQKNAEAQYLVLSPLCSAPGEKMHVGLIGMRWAWTS